MDARIQSTLPVNTGTTADRNASSAETAAIGMARRTTQRMPQRFTAKNMQTISVASTVTLMEGRNHCWIAEADNRAVRPQVGTHPPQ